MIVFLYKNFKNFPLIGKPIKVAYVGYLVKNLVKKTEVNESKKELINLSGNELESALNDEAKNLFDEAITPIITEEGIPEPLIRPVKDKAINKLTSVLKNKAIKTAEQKIIT
jgi:hypothetical protein